LTLPGVRSESRANLVPGQVVSTGVKIAADFTLELGRDHLALLYDAGLKEVTVGIRPEHFEVSDNGGIDVVVDLVEDWRPDQVRCAHRS
jgi:multiple sugar transport system ATP-binding protein